MKTVLVLFFILNSLFTSAQNLVVNGDFELYDSCPQLIGSVNGFLQSAYNPHLEATTDYYNSCDIQPDPCIDFGHVGIPLNSAGYQYAQSGNAYIGLIVYGFAETSREYIVIPLVSTLEKDSIYTISFGVSKPEIFGIATDAIMVAFSNSALPIEPIGFGVLPLEGIKMADVPIHDYENWTQLTKQYKAKGNENYIVIGNFLSDDETTLEESSFLPWVCSSTVYYGNEFDSYYYIDNVSVEKAPLFEFFPNVFTPNGDGINDRFVNLIHGYKILEASIFNRWGNSVYISENGVFNWDGTFNGELCTNGVYFYTALLEDENSGEILQKQGFFSLIH